MSLVTRRVLAWILSLPAAIALSAAIAMLRMPDAPAAVVVGIGLFVWPVLGFAIDRTLVAQAASFGAVTSGDVEACRALIAKRTRGIGARIDPFGTAAMEIFVGDVAMARARIHREPTPPFGPVAKLKRTVEAHANLAERGGAIAAFVLSELCDVGKLRAPGAERYRALVLAMAALTPNPLEGSPDWNMLVARALDVLSKHRDPEARAYAEWIRASRDVPPATESTVLELRRAAALATGHRLLPLAARIEVRASTRERELVGAGPYRG